MNFLELIPLPDAIPVHWGWFQVLLLVTFLLHLLFMNTMLGSSIIALTREFATKDGHCDLNKDLSLKLPYTVAFTVNIGVAPLLFIQVLYGHFMYTSSILMAVYWLSIVLLVIIAYYSLYIYDFKFDALGQGRRIFIAIAVILLLFVGFIFTNNMTLMMQPEKWTRYFTNPYGTLLNLQEKMLIPRYLHFVVGSIAVGGLFQAVVWEFKYKKKIANAKDAVHSGLNWFIGATFVQILIGIWFLSALPKDKMMLFLGADILRTSLLVIGIVCVLCALFFAVKRNVWATFGAALSTITIMVLMRDLLRMTWLKPYFSPASLKVVPEYSPMILFLVSFAAGLVVIFYMLKIAATAGKED
ncbi:MAG: hypothetical protein U9N77_11720 [Thermodesulfobacteriota bacterium]|nr:hypothetical protein [Thermodesulfobacteriota bacterium]